MKIKLLLTIVLFTASTKISIPQNNKITKDGMRTESSATTAENLGGFKISIPDTGGNPLQCTVTGNSSICLGTSGTLTSMPSGGTSPYSFLWSNGQTTQTIFVNPSATTTFTVTVTDAVVAHSNCSKLVTVNPLPPALITGSSSICNGSSTTLTASGGTTFSWSPTTGLSDPNTSNPIANPTATITYTVTVTTTAGCTATASKTLTVNPLPSASITAAGPTTFCDGGNVTLNAVVAANRSYQWKRGTNNISGATASNYIASVSGTYKVNVTNTLSGCSKTTAAGTVVNVNPQPLAQLTPTGTISICAGQSVKLKATNQFGYSFQWKKNNVIIPNAIGDSLMVTTAGRYKVLVMNQFGCLNTSKADTVVVPCREEMIIDITETNSLLLYPNPANDYLQFGMTSTAEIIEVEILNLMGTTVMNKTITGNENGIYSENFDISTLPAGVYIFKVAGSGQQVKKFVKR